MLGTLKDLEMQWAKIMYKKTCSQLALHVTKMSDLKNIKTNEIDGKKHWW